MMSRGELGGVHNHYRGLCRVRGDSLKVTKTGLGGCCCNSIAMGKDELALGDCGQGICVVRVQAYLHRPRDSSICTAVSEVMSCMECGLRSHPQPLTHTPGVLAFRVMTEDGALGLTVAKASRREPE